ncbi:hypothetical protein [Pseudoalteromonas sp. Of7M-16]|uniref:hypothetical protein n=1 Tax=Pseudoalteromonas sp. Of7M-16 TaxID=2917756 RepID=UPI001EF69CAA|nr:hypothetical protein [Pseudoalteromonas sp. Of7M-16]MCG7550899.1 hypothetical protein [Pseudoalteromonas sp. Of7M-16]
MKDCNLLKDQFDKDCGCVEQEWDTPVGFLSLHLKPCGTGEVHIDNGDYGAVEFEIEAKSKEGFMSLLEERIHSAPVIQE